MVTVMATLGELVGYSYGLGGCVQVLGVTVGVVYLKGAWFAMWKTTPQNAGYM